jgi:hypothetical protein
MSRAPVLIGVFIAGAATALVALYAALRFAPFGISASDADSALTIALRSRLQSFPAGSVVYLKGPAAVPHDLQLEYPTLRLVPWDTRPEDHGCDARPGILVIAPCLRNDFVSAELMSFPVAYTAIVSVTTSNSGGQLILIKLGARWHVLIDHYFVM